MLSEQARNNDEFFYSHDLSCVAYLLCLKKYELVGLDKTIKNKVLFIIKRDKEIDTEINNYWNFETSVDAQTYFNQLKRLKNQIFSSS